MTQKTKQVILIRRDLKMRRGKEVAQGSHASQAFLVKSLLSGKPLSDEDMLWLTGTHTKVCLQVESEEELRTLALSAEELGLHSHLVMDAGLTEFAGQPTLTAGAIGPGDEEKINKITGHLKLY
jgi:peptidyl-tRNA hydrolase, PTH2 family